MVGTRSLRVLGVAALVVGAYLAGRGGRPAATGDAPARRVLYYVDPMHPAYRSNAPGKAPDCGMDLVAVYEGGEPRPLATATSVALTASQEEAANLQTEAAQLSSPPGALHTAGRVAPDESLTYRVTAGTDGWLRDVFSDQTGTRVRRGDKLSSFYARDFSAPQQAYVFALDALERLSSSASSQTEQVRLASQQVASTRDTLRFLGMGNAQLEELARTRREVTDIVLTAPVDGQILERHVAVGQRFTRGELLYRIANLDRVWVLADVFRADVGLLGGVHAARVAADGMPSLDAKVAPVPPMFDEQGRTGKLRLEVDNPRGLLVPGMIVDVAFEAPSRPVLTVAADAVIDSGATRRVFVAAGHGRYELREVETGRQHGDRVEIRSGLSAGERVVTAGAFLLDSESRMRTPSNLP